MIVNSSMVSKNYASMLNTQSQSGVNALAKNDFSSKMKEISNQLLSTLDTNKNGSIDKIEFSSAAMQLSQDMAESDKLFSRLDQNSDGMIDGNELLSALGQCSPQAPKANCKTNSHAQNGLQSILMKNILSAYNTSQSQTNGGSLSISV
ncbi:EF-hand domain-containing protein [Sulfurimonas sp. HSL3-2]|uniref:EF-hand domain-containing protein n=1 Tax=Hydrocurvibacter mobilis TaxID=3131936 RepID=UPI0031F99489